MQMIRLGSGASFRVAALVALFALVGSLGGCAFGEFRLGDPLDRKYTLEEAQHRYTVLVRWTEFEKAKRFIAKDDRDAFIAKMKVLSKARFTGHESEAIELEDGRKAATVQVTYSLYLPASPYEMEIGETQEWTRDGVTNHWTVVSTFDETPQLASN